MHSPHSTSGAHSTVAREAQAPTEQGDDVPAAQVDEKKKAIADTADVKVVAAAAVVESVVSVRVHRVQQHMSSHDRSTSPTASNHPPTHTAARAAQPIPPTPTTTPPLCTSPTSSLPRVLAHTISLTLPLANGRHTMFKPPLTRPTATQRHAIINRHSHDQPMSARSPKRSLRPEQVAT
jgi:hypothetical protein